MIKYNDSGNKFIYKKGLARSQPYVNRQNRKPVSVLICHLSSRSTPRKRAGSPFALADVPVYMIFLVLVPSPPYVAIRRRELLPRGFTLTLSGGLFSVTASIRLLPSVLSTAGCPFQSGLSSELPQRQKRSTYYFNELFISELSLHHVILSVHPFHFLFQGRSDVFAMFVTLH